MKRQKQNQHKSSRWRHAYFCFHLQGQDLSSSAQCSKNLRCPDFSWPSTTPGISYYTLTSTASGARIHILVRHCSAACCARKRMHCFPILLFLPTCGRKRFSFALVSKQNRYIYFKKCYLRGRKMLVSFNKWHVIWLHKTHKLLCYPRVTIFLYWKQLRFILNEWIPRVTIFCIISSILNNFEM